WADMDADTLVPVGTIGAAPLGFGHSGRSALQRPLRRIVAERRRSPGRRGDPSYSTLSSGSGTPQRLPVEILCPVDFDQHGMAALLRIAILLRLDETPPHLLVDRAG